MPKHLTFDGKFLEKLKSGKKTLTLRRHKPSANVGDIVYIHCHGYVIGKAIIKDIKLIKAKDITDEIAKQEGFKSKNELIQTLKEYYPDLNPETELWLISFEFIEIFKTPIFSESFAYMGIHPLEIVEKALDHKHELDLPESDWILLELLYRVKSIRKASEMLGSLSKRKLFRRALKRALEQLLEKGYVKPRIKIENNST